MTFGVRSSDSHGHNDFFCLEDLQEKALDGLSETESDEEVPLRFGGAKSKIQQEVKPAAPTGASGVFCIQSLQIAPLRGCR